MSNLLLVLVCLVAGALARRSGRFPEATPVVLNRVVVDVALPALTFAAVHGLGDSGGLGREVALALAVPWALFAIALGVCWPFVKLRGWTAATLGCLLLTAGHANTSFVGFPLVEALYGRQALKTAVWVDQGQFLVLATAGMVTAAVAAGRERPRALELGRRLIGFPPFVAFLAALALLSVRVPAPISALLDQLAALVVPLALLSVGWWLGVSPRPAREDVAPLALGLTVRLVVAPALVALALFAGLGLRGEASAVIVAESAMAPMITGALLAIEFGLAPRLAASMVSLGVPLSLVTVPAWAWLFARL